MNDAPNSVAELARRVDGAIAHAIVGGDRTSFGLMIALLTRGHALIEGVPGTGKTLAVRAFAAALGLEFRRIQFTPDLMPADVVGTNVFNPQTTAFSVRPGPIVSNVVLADEINRTPPKTQAALLQAMQEGEVSVGRQTYQLKPPFYVVATQNPIEMEGTYPLPEAQVDRFMFSLKVKYPTVDEEVKIIKGTTSTLTGAAQMVLKSDEVLRLQELVRGVPIADSVVRFAARLAAASRPGEVAAIDGVHKYIAYGASPRASQFLVLGAKARAILAGKYHVDFLDIKALAKPVFRHRLVLNFHARADGVDTETIIDRLLKAVPQEG